MSNRRVLLVVCGFFALASAGAWGDERWGSTGHQHITAGALAHLPQPLRWFFETNSGVVVTQSGIEPPFTHYIDIDYYPEFFAGTFPHDENALVAIYGWSVVEDNGVGPWALDFYATNLTTAMAGAHTAQDWQNVLATAGILAHFVADLHNPLHLTMNYNGQLTGNTGIHSRYESQMVSRYLTQLPIAPAPAECVYLPSVLDAVFDSIDVNYWFVDDIMAGDTHAASVDPGHHTAYYATLWADTGPFTQVLFQQASEMLASAWYTAWINAGSPAPVPSGPVGDLNCDGTVDFGDINPFVQYLSNIAAWQASYPGCPAVLGDINGDGTYPSFGDINPFVTLLTGG